MKSISVLNHTSVIQVTQDSKTNKFGINHLNNDIQIKSIEGQEGQVQDLD